MITWYANLLARAQCCVDDKSMILAIRQWISRAISLCLIGPVAAVLAARLVAPDGSGQHTLLTGDSLVAGVFALLSVMLLTSLAGILSTVLGGRREGLLNMAFVLGWVAWTTGRMGNIYRISPDTGTLLMLSIEALLLAVGVIVTASIMSVQDDRDPVSSFAVGRLSGWFKQKPMLAAIGGGLVGAVVMAWLWGRTDLPGQSVGVGFFGGLLAGVMGAMAAGSVSEKGKHGGTPFAPIMIGMMLCGVVAPMIGVVVPGVGKLEDLAISGALPGYLAVSPAAWIMGALMGTPVGHSWVEHTQAQSAAKPAEASLGN